jgi:hypothetical protein
MDPDRQGIAAAKGCSITFLLPGWKGCMSHFIAMMIGVDMETQKSNEFKAL